MAAAGQAVTIPANWVGSWATSQQLPEPQNSLSAEDLRDATLRQIVHLSVGGPELRVHVSNAFGKAPLHLTAVHVARPSAAGGGAIDPASDKALTFGGAQDVTVPAGAEFISDPVAFPVGGAVGSGDYAACGCGSGFADGASGVAGDFVFGAWGSGFGGEFA